MIDELKFHLKQGPATVKDLVRKTGRTDSGIRKALATIDGVVEGVNYAGHKTFALPPKQDGPEPQKQPKGKQTPAERPDVAPAQPEAQHKDKRGRKASFAGKKLFPSDQLPTGDGEPKTYTNPRRAGSHGYCSLQIIIDNPGLTTEEYVRKGGRLNDLRWDVTHGNVKVG